MDRFFHESGRREKSRNLSSGAVLGEAWQAEVVAIYDIPTLLALSRVVLGEAWQAEVVAIYSIPALLALSGIVLGEAWQA